MSTALESFILYHTPNLHHLLSDKCRNLRAFSLNVCLETCFGVLSPPTNTRLSHILQNTNLRRLEDTELICPLAIVFERLHLIRAASSATAPFSIIRCLAVSLIRRVDELVDCLERRAHDDQGCDKYAGVHLDDSQYVVEDVRVLGFGLGEGIRIEHDDESSDGQAGMNKSEENQADELPHLWTVFLELGERWDGESNH